MTSTNSTEKFRGILADMIVELGEMSAESAENGVTYKGISIGLNATEKAVIAIGKVLKDTQAALLDKVEATLPEERDDSDPYNTLNPQEVGEIMGFNDAVEQQRTALTKLKETL